MHGEFGAEEVLKMGWKRNEFPRDSSVATPLGET